MGAYHQMGHTSWNLVGEDELADFSGIVLSPVNDSPEQVIERLGRLRESVNHRKEIILDPQFYKPSSDRGRITSWPHFSNDLDTADLGDIGWWRKRAEKLTEVAHEIKADSICSPAYIPRVFGRGYYEFIVRCAEETAKIAAPENIDVLISALVNFTDLGQKNQAETIASNLTSTSISRIYLVILGGNQPREHHTDLDSLTGLLRLIRLLEEAGTKVLVAFCGLDMLLWKAAGATSVATGKFFNLRRFIPERWDDLKEGGQIVAYWTDEQLISWLREADVRLLDRLGLLDRGAAKINPFSSKILDVIDEGKGEAWLGLSWRQYLYWFMKNESILTAQPNRIDTFLSSALANWKNFSTTSMLMHDERNDGSWIRQWSNAIQMSRRY